MSSRLALGFALLSLGAMPQAAAAQQYRLRVESQFQSVAFRGVAMDSILASATVTAPDGGRETPDGFAVRCGIGETYCFYFRSGPIKRAGPSVTSAAATVWGLGVAGLSLRADARLVMDLGDSRTWPGTVPIVQLLEGYAEYSVERYRGRLGRQVYTSRLGFSGFDGARATVRFAGGRLEADGYLGWGLGRGSALPVNSEVLNPLDDFQPRQRQIVAGAAVGWNHRRGTLRLDYQREVDPRSDYFVSERAAAVATLRLPARLNLDLGTEYDIAMGRWGSTDATLRYTRRTLALSGGFQRYRPHFELWTIWGAFSPVGYNAVHGSVTVIPLPGLSVRARGSRFWFEETETETPLVTVEDRGWRVSLGASYSPLAILAFSADHATEFGPGGSSTSITGSVSYLPRSFLTFSLHGGRINRPLEFRFDEATLHMIGVEGEWQISERWRGSLGATTFVEERDRPDAAAFDWNQTRVVARLSVLLGWEPDHLPLPPAAPRRPTERPR